MVFIQLLTTKSPSFARNRGSLIKKAATYSPALHCSTIGDGGLNFSVRNGKRWDPAAITTWFFRPTRQDNPDRAYGWHLHTSKTAGQHTASDRNENDNHYDYCTWYNWRHGLKGKSRAISTARLWRHRLYTCCLSTSSSGTALNGVLISRMASRLDAFSAYPNQARIPGGAPGGTTGKPEACPTRSSRTSARTTQYSCAHDR